MGKVLSRFQNGFPGAVSRSADTVIISARNASGAEIPFGAPVFQVSGENACRVFSADTSTPETFLGFAVRAADKTPDTYGSNLASYAPGDPVDVLVRGSAVIAMETAAAAPGDKVYVRKADGKTVAAAGAEGTTINLPGVTVRTVRDENKCAEVVLTRRNLL